MSSRSLLGSSVLVKVTESQILVLARFPTHLTLSLGIFGRRATKFEIKLGVIAERRKSSSIISSINFIFSRSFNGNIQVVSSFE